ncbi:response regulator transcription factor [Flavobacterium yafengii]|uniref:response regulator transcription factor n=1 Tax=Flavobacterium yafengii TaxID=3041253 RepID=UPI0024A8E026|nr:DNA-binding response regulator [Flavobacterium yafengii]MDI5896891.1 DNA-binding response regulator [Flavobacterium yafengii]
MRNQKIKIVLIEDDKALGNSILELLALNDFDVNWFEDGLEALVYLNKNTPDIVISDLMMPHMDGEELFLKIRKNSKFNTIPFIMITANTDDDVKFKQLENGVNDFIMKPFKVKELIYKIKSVVELKKSIEKKFSPDPFSKITIKLSEKDFLTSLNEILIKNLKSKIDVNELSMHLFISKSTLDKRIRKRTNKNISQYMREFRLDYAIKLIHSGERNIQYLVSETGFSSFSYFTTSFKSYLNVTPRDYIKSIQIDKNGKDLKVG